MRWCDTARMTPLETLGVALLTAVAAAVVASITTLLVEGRKHGYEDRIRFIDLRRERYSELLREADQHVRILRRQLGVVEGRIQGVDATMAASIAAGVWYSSVLRGRAFSLAATASRSAWL